ncbi:MAG: hypothetical protein GX606_03440, partial [Elusimicrobia bacterium]|nr:hypothetical protein [Elusimicrobiota bacterium]
MSSPRRWPAWLPWILGALIPILLGIWVRLYPLTHHVTSDAYDKSTLLVLNRVRMAVTAQVERQYPQLPPEQKERIIQNLFQEMVRKDNAKIRKAFDTLGQNMAQADGKDKHYLLASDSYYYLDLTERILTDGSPGKIKGSQYFNDRMLAPVGYWEPQTWHPYIGAWVHRVVSRFSPGTDLMTNVGFTPLILFPLVIAAFLLGCWACGHHWFPGSIAATFMAMAPIYLKRSSYGWYDNDTYSILFPLLGMAWLIAAVGRRDRKTAGIFLTLCALTLALYTQFWYGWWFILGIMAIGLVAIGIVRKMTGHLQWRAPLFTTGGLLLILGVFLLLFYGPRHSIDILFFAWGELNKFILPKLRDWPDLFIMVGELHNGSLLETIRQSGGWIFFVGGLWPLVWAFRGLLRKEPPSDRSVLLGTFLLVTFILSLGAQRFSLLCLPALGLLFSETLQVLWAQRSLWAERFKAPPRTATVLIVSGSLILTAFSVAHGRGSVAKNLNTIFNSAWDRALSRIEQETPTESIINAWWAPGHFIKAIAKRGVLFDGASIRGDIAYWLTQAYLSPDEDKAVD